MARFKAPLMAVTLVAACLQGCENLPGEPAQTAGPADDASETVNRKLESIVTALTLEQKLMLVRGQGFSMPGEETQSFDIVPGAAGYTFSVPQAGLQSIVMADGPAGLRILPQREGEQRDFYATAFPIASNLAASWDDKLLQQVGAAMGQEAREYGVDIILGPGMNIQRNPLGGRNYEYYAEDPFLSGHLAAAMVEGIQSQGVGATIKHFVANNQETNRFLVDTIVSERTLREMYLRGFEIAVKQSQPWALMSAYNKLNGTYTPQSYELLTSVLRDEWGYKGVVMSDWWAGDDPVAALNAGNDLIMPGTPETSQLLRAGSENGRLQSTALENSTDRIVRLALKTLSNNGHTASNQPDLEAHAQLARRASAEGIVLLKNQRESLPITTDTRIAAFGNTSYDFIAGGFGSGDVNEAYTISLLQGLEFAGFKLHQPLRKQYEAFIREAKAKRPAKKHFLEPETKIEELSFSEAALTTLAEKTDIAIITLGRVAGEMQDLSEHGDFELTAGEIDLINKVSSRYHPMGKKVIVVLNIGNLIDITPWRDKVDAIVVAWQGGQESGNAVADVLSGRVNPSGKLTQTWPAFYRDVPSAGSFPGYRTSDQQVSGINGFSVGYPSETLYDEGLFVGYRYYDRFDVVPAYPFGYGLSFSQFDYLPAELSSSDKQGNRTVTLTIRNSGKRPGKEVVQLYVSAPAKTLHKPLRELKGYAKTALLKSGDQQTVSFQISPEDLASFDSARSAWVAEPGEYTVSIGSSSRDIHQTVKFNLNKEILVQQTQRVLEPKKPISELQPQG